MTLPLSGPRNVIAGTFIEALVSNKQPFGCGISEKDPPIIPCDEHCVPQAIEQLLFKIGSLRQVFLFGAPTLRLACQP
jgi:hypothetical protein